MTRYKNVYTYSGEEKSLSELMNKAIDQATLAQLDQFQEEKKETIETVAVKYSNLKTIAVDILNNKALFKNSNKEDGYDFMAMSVAVNKKYNTRFNRKEIKQILDLYQAGYMRKKAEAEEG
jgi:hypothetical protein